MNRLLRIVSVVLPLAGRRRSPGVAAAMGSFTLIALLLAAGDTRAAGQSFTPNPTHFAAPWFGWIVDARVLLLFGLLAQILFSARMIVQVWYSHHRKRSLIPPEFWYLSSIAAGMLLVYFFVRSDPVGLLLQLLLGAIYLRNIYLLWRKQLPRGVRRRIGAFAAVAVAGFGALLLCACLIEGPRQTLNQPNPDKLSLPFSGVVLPIKPVLAFGFLGSAIFSLRFFVQWIASERAGDSVTPVSFWALAAVGSIMLLLYFSVRSDPIGVLGQATGLPTYLYNLCLIRRNRNKSTERRM